VLYRQVWKTFKTGKKRDFLTEARIFQDPEVGFVLADFNELRPPHVGFPFLPAKEGKQHRERRKECPEWAWCLLIAT
jgi:hypothetical protein